MAGMHGDEINGMEIVEGFIDTGLHRTKRGTVVLHAHYQCLWLSELFTRSARRWDNNRSFPGKTWLVGHWRAWPHDAWHHSLHWPAVLTVSLSGGAQRTNHPQVRCVMAEETNVALAKAFSAPFTIDSPFRPHSFAANCREVQKHHEGGESIRFDQHAIEEGISGTLRLDETSRHEWLGTRARKKTKIIWNSSRFAPRQRGVSTEYKCGDLIEKGQLVGSITDPFGEFKTLKSPAKGCCWHQ